MYKVIMVSPGGTKRDYQGGFITEKEAQHFADQHACTYCDENGFVWNLEVTEDMDTTADLVIPNKQWAELFLEFIENGDDQALNYLDEMMENSFNREQRLKYIAIRRLVDSLIPLNHIIALMEYDEILLDPVIEEAYRNMMNRLTEIAKKSSSIE